MKRWVLGLLAVLFPFALLAAKSGDDHVLAARDAFAKGDRAQLERGREQVRGHVLEPYVEYWVMRNRLEEASADQIEGFLRRHEGTWIAERLRQDWLKLLGKNRLWEDFERAHATLVQGDQELSCYALQARFARQDASALEEAASLWRSVIDLPASCVPLMEALFASRGLRQDDAWARVRSQIESRRVAGARAAAAYLPSKDAPDARSLETVVRNPEGFLSRMKANFAATRAGRELAMAGLARLARSDPVEAESRFATLRPRFSAAERGYVYAQLGWQGALRHLPQALHWYRAAGDAPLSEDQHEWKVRAALRASDWRAVSSAIEEMPVALAERSAWIYWLGRARQAQGKAEEAREFFARIAGQPHFYGNLADEELGSGVAVPPRAARPGPEEHAAVAADPGVQRALALFRLDLRYEGVREWNWALRGRDDRFLLAAAELAHREQIFDRAINTADRTRAEHDYTLRYLAPFREFVEPRLRELDLDNAWVYGLMRQESRFVMNAKSSAGARGLMQLMPSTAKWVAGRIGLKDFRLSQVNDMDINVALGTSYLKMVLDDLDSHPVLASAAYNAGPGRARRWRDSKPLEGAIYIETIPFDETRDYVKKVMSNAVYYDAVLNGRARALKTRLGVVHPAGAGSPRDLP